MFSPGARVKMALGAIVKAAIFLFGWSMLLIALLESRMLTRVEQLQKEHHRDMEELRASAVGLHHAVPSHMNVRPAEAHKVAAMREAAAAAELERRAAAPPDAPAAVEPSPAAGAPPPPAVRAASVEATASLAGEEAPAPGPPASPLPLGPEPPPALDWQPLGRAPRVGVLLGYDSRSRVAPGSFGAVGLRLARRWVELHDYSLFVEPNLGRLGGGAEAPVWDKIAAVRHYLPKVDILFWLDLDVLVVDPSRKVEELLRSDPASCARTGQAEDDARLATRAGDIFLWAASARFAHFDSGGWEHKEPAYKLNLCAGAFALRNHPASFEFLEEVWSQRHNRNWPAEQGAMWSVLLQYPDLLSRTCVLSEDLFVYESLESPGAVLGRPGPFAIHATGYKGKGADEKRNAIGRAACDRVFAALGGCPEPGLAEK